MNSTASRHSLDAADAGNRQAACLGVAGDFRDHVQRDGLHNRPAHAACVPMPPTGGQGVIASMSTPIIELTVLMSETASAPPFFAASAGRRMLCDIRRELHDDGMRVCCLHQRVTISIYFRHLPTAAPMPRSLMPCGQPKFQLDAIGLGFLDSGENVLPAVFRTGHHQRDGPARGLSSQLHLLDLLQVHLQRSIV